MPIFLGVASLLSNGLLADNLQQDPAIIKGELENGLDYVILPLSDTPSRTHTEVRLIVHSGSAHETEKQLGYAHFVEHMAFNGTVKYPKNELVKFIEKAGMDFGQDLNAYTSYEETVYQLSVPKGEEELLNTALDINNEWLFNLTFAADEVKKEIGVIVEEWRLRLEYQHSNHKQQLHAQYEGHHFMDRHPIGTPESIESATVEELSNYYQRWYHPDNATLVVVGVVDAKAIESQIREIFTSKQAQTFEAIQFESAEIPKATNLSFNDSTSGSYVGFVNYKQQKAQSNQQTLTKHTHNSLLNSIIINRFDTWSMVQKISPIGGVHPFQYDHFADLNHTGIAVGTSQSQWSQALKQIEIQRLRLVELGVSEQELNSAKAVLRANVKQYMEGLSTASAAEYIRDLEGKVISNFTLTNEHDNGQFMLDVIEKVQIEDLNRLAKNQYGRVHHWIGSGNKEYAIKLKDRTLKRLLKQAAKTPIKPFENEQETVLSYVLPEVKDEKITAVVHSKENGIEKLQLANGIEVFLKPSLIKPNYVSIRFTSDVGISNFPKALQPYAATFSSTHYEQGLMDKGARGTSEFLQTEQVSVNGDIYGESSVVLASGNKLKSDLMLELMHRSIAEPLAFKHVKTIRGANTYSGERETPDGEYNYQYQNLLWGQQADFINMPADSFSGMRDGQMQKLLPYIFSKQGQPRVVVTGDFDREKILKQINKNFGSFELTQVSLEPLPKAELTNADERIVAKNPEQRSDVSIIYRTPTEMDPSYQRYGLSSIYSDLISQDLFEVIREKDSLAYGPRAYLSNMGKSDNHWQLSLQFSTDPIKQPLAVEVANKVVANFLQKDTTQAEIDEAIKRLSSNHESYLNNIDNLNYEISHQVSIGTELKHIFSYQAVLNNITAKQFNAFKKNLMEKAVRYQIVFAPEDAELEDLAETESKPIVKNNDS